MDVRDVRPEAVDQPRGCRIDCGVAVRLFKRARVAERVVDRRDSQAVTHFRANGVFGPRRVRFPRENEDIVALLEQGTGVRLGVDFRAAESGRREAVDDDQNPHQTPLDRDSRQPLAADSAPEYWPSGQANARPTARRSFWKRTCVTSDDTVARARCGSVGIVRSPKSS